MATASSQRPAVSIGDHDMSSTPSAACSVPVGSNNQHLPPLARTVAAHNCITSGFVEVTNTGPGAVTTAGITIETVFPDLGGPKTSTACSPRATVRSPDGAVPRSTPPPRDAHQSATGPAPDTTGKRFFARAARRFAVPLRRARIALKPITATISTTTANAQIRVYSRLPHASTFLVPASP
jgi:hypothetical protein